jgi:hypothetical protein
MPMSCGIPNIHLELRQYNPDVSYAHPCFDHQFQLADPIFEIGCPGQVRSRAPARFYTEHRPQSLRGTVATKKQFGCHAM